MNKDLLKQDILDFQQSFYDYLDKEVPAILDHLKTQLDNQEQKREVEIVSDTLEYLAEQLKDFNKSINELLFDDKGDKE